MHPKLRKFIRTPGQFVVDFTKKRLRTHPAGGLFAGGYKSSRRYSVVSAVYQVEKYLDDFLQSLVNQTMAFERHIQVVLVDDGSTDRSLEIARYWQRRYPNNILIVEKENGGVSSARNAGLLHVDGDWVTFSDPDDILDARYFEEVDRFLDKHLHDNIGLVGTQLFYFFEKSGRIRNTHPLKAKYAQGNVVIELDKLAQHIHMSVATGFMRADLLSKMALSFDERVKAGFEDAHFIGRYLMLAGNAKISYVATSLYYYRKRADKTSALDTSWHKRERFSDVMQYGCLDLLQIAARLYVRPPEWLQNMVLYHLVSDIRHLVNHAERLSFLDRDTQRAYLDLCRQCFDLIDAAVIERFELAGCDDLMKAGLLGFFKCHDREELAIHVGEYDDKRGLVKLSYFYSMPADKVEYRVNEKHVDPAFIKTRLYDFMGTQFVCENIAWIPLLQKEKLSVVVNSASVTLNINETKLSSYLYERKTNPARSCTRSVAAKLLVMLSRIKWVRESYRDLWILMDRDMAADDNAEHLYRYLMRLKVSPNKAFVLRRDSYDWARLKREGFTLIPFGSLRHRLALLHAKYVISSHVDTYVTSFLPQRMFGDLLGYKFVFLQHGVMHSDLSGWLNSKPIDLFMTSTPAETENIAADIGSYKFTKREVVMTGMPRHDRLLAMAHMREKLIVIMPTWRKYLVGETIGAGNLRKVNPDFIYSDYAAAWKNVLHSPQLKSLADAHGYRVLFCPHKNIEPYLDLFDTPDWIEVYHAGKGESIQTLFARAALMVTDYSSVAFEMGFLQRPVIYYQFDRETFFNGGHIGQSGYFDYQRDGFGPVCETEKALFDDLDLVLQANAEMPPEIKDRAEKTFPYSDGGASQRVVDAIHKIR